MPPSSLTKDDDILNTEITLGVLAAIDRNHAVTQRNLAKDLGIALGLANTYLRRCAKKGLIKIMTVPANRYAYYLTPQGFAEKSRLTAEFLTQSFKLFRIARATYTQLLEECARAGKRRVVVVGGTDLADIILLCVNETACSVVATVAKPPIPDEVGEFDIVVVADLTDPQGTFDTLVSQFGRERVVVPSFLNISERRTIMDEIEP